MMFDFEYNNKWDVDKKADSLNTSLFGKSKQKQKAKAVHGVTKKQNELHTSVIHDSDDEKYSRKGKKKLKERRRKKNKLSGNTKSEEGKANVSLINDNENDSPKVLVKGDKKKQKNKKQNTDPKHSPKADEMNTGKSDSQLKKQKKKIKDGTSVGEEERKAVGKKDRKRKRSMSEDAEADGVDHAKKRAKLENKPVESEATENGEKGKKKRRNRKKKNNSKKNKYKHLAQNSSKAKETNSSHPQNIEEIPQGSDPKKHTGFDLNGKRKDKSLIKKKDVAESEQKLDESKCRVQPVKKEAQKRKKKKSETSSIFISDHDVGMDNSDSPENSLRKKKKVTDVQMSTMGNNSNCVIGKGVKDKKRAGKKIKFANGNPPVANLSSSQLKDNPKAGKMNVQQSKLSKAAKLKQQTLIRMLGQAEEIEHSPSKGVQNTNSQSSKVKTKLKHKGKDFSTSDALSKQQMSPKLKSTKAERKVPSKQKKSASPFSETVESPKFSSLWGKGAELGLQAKEKLHSARFRYINEQLYSCQGSEAWQMFRDDPDAFQVYHQGFENQVNKWSVNPLDVIIKHMKDKSPKLVVADFGCGDAKLAESVPQKVHSFDLVALNKRVTVCDISKTPLPSESVDIGIFCLSLMGTNISDYIHEANRVLKTGGLLKIAEVVSRFSGVSGFIAGVCKHGFQLLNKRDLSDMFYLMDFKKVSSVKKSVSVGEIKLKPCIYKKR